MATNIPALATSRCAGPAPARDGEIIVETRVLLTAPHITHAVEVDAHGTPLRVLCGAVPLQDIGTKSYGVPTCPRCVRVDARPVRCPRGSLQWFNLELRRIAAEPWRVWYDAKEKAERDAEAARVEAERKRAKAEAEREGLARLRRERDEERRAWSRWRKTQHVSLTAREREETELLERDWAAAGLPVEEEEELLIYSAVGDCGKKHLSLAAACACANVRREEAELRAGEARAARSLTAAPRPLSLSGSAPREAVEVASIPGEMLASSSQEQASCLREVPRSAINPEAATLTERILAVVRRGSYRSVNGIVHALTASDHGARRQDVYAAVATMLADGRLWKVTGMFRAADA